MHPRALFGMDKALGPDHTVILATVNKPGFLCCNQGKLEEAEDMYKRTITGFRLKLGEGDPSYTTAMASFQTRSVEKRRQ